MRLSKVGEFRLIERVTRGLPRGPDLRVGVGDDAAVVRVPGPNDLLITTDMLVEGRHFRRDWSTLREIGQKALLVNVSDIAAMGGRPRYAVVACGLPPKLSLRSARDLFGGIRTAARRAGLFLVGGDTNRSNRLILSLTVVGEVEEGRGLLRSGARVGDAIYVSGRLGRGGMNLKGHKIYLPPIRVSLGRALLKRKLARSCIDLSDGLLADLRHILEASGVGAEVQVEEIPGKAPLPLKLTGGEDYELLFTASRRARVPRKIGGVPLTRIGRIIPGVGKIRLIGRGGRPLPLPKRMGYTHF